MPRFDERQSDPRDHASKARTNRQPDAVPPSDRAGLVLPAVFRPDLGANDGPVDVFIQLCHDRASDAELALILDPVQKADHRQNQTVPDQIAGQFSAQQMRTLGSSLLKLADALDDDWQPEMVRSKYHWVTGAGQIERNALPLAQVAMRLRRSA
jgi:hypothetical protein